MVVRFVDGTSAQGGLVTMDGQTLSLVVDPATSVHDLADVIAIEVGDPLKAADPTADRWVLLAGGDRAPLSPFDLVDDHLVCRRAGADRRADWRVPLQFVTSVLYQPLVSRGASSHVPELSFRKFAEDTLILRDGTRLTGVLEDLSTESIRIETAVGAVSVEVERVDAIALDSALVQQPDAGPTSALLMTRDGAWLTLHAWSVNADSELEGRTHVDTEFRIPLADVARIACYGPRVVDLTTRTIADTRVTPFVSRVEEMLINRNVRGGFLGLDDREYARGFGMTSGMSATFPLEPEDRQFRAIVGLDDAVGNEGSVVFTVDVDGRRVYTSPLVTGADPAIVVGPLEIAGGKQLTLSVEFAEYGNVQDVANWSDPVILR